MTENRTNGGSYYEENSLTLRKIRSQREKIKADLSLPFSRKSFGITAKRDDIIDQPNQNPYVHSNFIFITDSLFRSEKELEV